METQANVNVGAQYTYATFLARLVAAIIDAILIGIVGAILSTVFGNESSLGSLLSTVISWGYLVAMTVKYGATSGKKAMNIRVQNQTTGQNLTVMEAILREVVGKFLSAIVLGLGYFWMIWDPSKQTWHDKLGKSVVVKLKA